MKKDVSRILVVSRSTRYCQKAVHYGVSLARKYSAELFVMHVIYDPFSLEGWNLPVPSLQQEYENLLRTAREGIHRIVEAEKVQGLEITETIREGKPVNETIKMVKQHKIDLLIMLAHEEGHLEHFLFGRSNEELIRRMPCSIMLIKKKYSRIG